MSTVKAADFQHKDSVVANLSLNSGGGVSVYGVGDVSSALAAKAPSASPTFTGTVALPSTTTLNGATLAPAGLVLIATQTFTAASTVNVNSCFSSSYQSYRIFVDVSAASSTQLWMRLRAVGTDAITNYTYGLAYGTKSAAAGNAAAASDNTFANTTSFPTCDMDATNGGGFFIDVENPNLARVTMFNGFYNKRATGTLAGLIGAFHNTATAYDGFTLYPGTGNVTGTVRIYGYGK